jgi:MFS family permease
MKILESENEDQLTVKSPTNQDHNLSMKSNLEKSINSHGFIPVFKNRRFLILWLGQIFSQLADKVYLVLMIAIIADRFQQNDQSISGWVSAIMIAFTIPAVLFGSLAGVYVDRWSKKSVLVVSNLWRGILVLILPFLLLLSSINRSFFNLPLGFWILLIVTFCVSTLTQFFAPAEQSALPLIVKTRHLLAANSLYTTTMMALLIIGFAIGEPMLAFFGNLIHHLNSHWDFGKELMVGGCYVIAGLILLFLNTGEKAKDQTEMPHVLTDIADGIKYLSQNHKVRNALIQLVILFSVFAALAVLAVTLADQIPGMKAQRFGILLASTGLGMGLGATAIGNWGQRLPRRQLSLWGSCGMTVSLIGLAFLGTKFLWAALLCTFCLGTFAAFVGVPMQTTIQTETPEDMRGKVFGLQNNAVNIALSLPLALAGVAETIFGLQPVLLGLSLLVILGGFLNYSIMPTVSKS